MVVLEHDSLRLVLEPSLGARVVSLVDRRTGREWLVQESPHDTAATAGWAGEDAAFGGAQAFGWDECLPTVAPGPDPLDPSSAEDRLTLTSYVWPDQVDRFERLRGALQVAAAAPERVERLGGAAFLERELHPRDGVVTVVWHSVVWQYVPPDERTRITDAVEAAGRRATPWAPVAHLALEPEHVERGGFVLRLQTWPDGESRLLADAQGHGPPVVWR